jgi:hypothetical protein
MRFQYSGTFHDGPVIMHISRVPDGNDIHTYDGSGEWVKFYSLGAEFRPTEDGGERIWWKATGGVRVSLSL